MIARSRPARTALAGGVVGYTMVELMLALALLALGSAGIITLQRVTAQSNRHSKQLATATHIAQTWIDHLVADSSQWQQSGVFSDTDWLASNPPLGWFEPSYKANRNWGRAFDLSGTAQQFPDDSTVFCSHLRLNTLYNEGGAEVPGLGLIRAEVRVFWQRTPVAELGIPLGNHPCVWSVDQISGPDGVKAHHFVYMTTALLQNDQ